MQNHTISSTDVMWQTDEWADIVENYVSIKMLLLRASKSIKDKKVNLFYWVDSIGIWRKAKAL